MDARKDFLFLLLLLLRLLRRRACRCGAGRGCSSRSQSTDASTPCTYRSSMNRCVVCFSLSLRHALATRKHSPPKKKAQALPRGKIVKRRRRKSQCTRHLPQVSTTHSTARRGAMRGRASLHSSSSKHSSWLQVRCAALAKSGGDVNSKRARALCVCVYSSLFFR